MTNVYSVRGSHRYGVALVAALLMALGCKSEAEKSEPEGPFRSVSVAANDPAAFTQPLAGVPLSGDRTAILAFQKPTDTGMPAAPAIFVAEPTGTIRLLHAGAPLASPFDIDVSADGQSVLVADQHAGDDGTGAILAFSLADGAAAEPEASGYSPVSATVAADGSVYFSGRKPDTGEPGVFRLEVGGSVTTVYAGSPLVDPSGIALFADGRVLVADTRLFDENDVGSEAGVVLLDDGTASVFVTGFETGYPAGIALTVDESTLIISGEGADDRDKVYIVDVATRSASVVEAEFSSQELSSGGLKRDRTTNRFIWASGSYNGGTVYTIEG